MSRQELINQATVKYYAQLQREFEFRQAVRAGKIELCPQSRVSVEQLSNIGWLSHSSTL